MHDEGSPRACRQLLCGSWYVVIASLMSVKYKSRSQCGSGADLVPLPYRENGRCVQEEI